MQTKEMSANVSYDVIWGQSEDWLKYQERLASDRYPELSREGKREGQEEDNFTVYKQAYKEP